MPTPTLVIVETHRPGSSRRYPFGRVVEGWFIQDSDGVIWLTEPDGTKLGPHDSMRPYGSLDARQTAATLLKDKYARGRSDFGRKIEYPEGF